MPQMLVLSPETWASIRQQPLLQRGWQLSLGIGLTGMMLLLTRLLGSFQPDSDWLRSLGTIWLLNGGLLLFAWNLLRLTAPLSGSSGQAVLWLGLQFLGALGLTWALLPISAPSVVLAAAVSLLCLGSCFWQLALALPWEATPTTTATLPESSSSVAPPAANGTTTTDLPARSQTTTPQSTPIENNIVEPTPVESTRVESTAVEPTILTNCSLPNVLESSERDVERTSATEPPEHYPAVDACLPFHGPLTPPQQLVQWQSRTQSPDGSQTVEGMIRLDLAAGQTQRSAHVSFTPALPGLPEMECEPLTEATVEASIGAVYAHGFRVDVRRVGTSQTDERIEIGFQAVCPARAEAA